jgi:hypothetical protein
MIAATTLRYAMGIFFHDYRRSGPDVGGLVDEPDQTGCVLNQDL